MLINLRFCTAMLWLYRYVAVVPLYFLYRYLRTAIFCTAILGFGLYRYVCAVFCTAIFGFFGCTAIFVRLFVPLFFGF